jgi:hypothetical protein
MNAKNHIMQLAGKLKKFLVGLGKSPNASEGRCQEDFPRFNRRDRVSGISHAQSPTLESYR